VGWAGFLRGIINPVNYFNPFNLVQRQKKSVLSRMTRKRVLNMIKWISGMGRIFKRNY
jgi:hypothetical protein